MTKHLRIFLALVLLMAVSAAKADILIFDDGSFKYTVNTFTHSAQITSYYGPKTDITISDSITVKGVTYPVTSLGKQLGSYKITSVTIPNSVTDLEEYCFYRCTSLKSVTIPNSVTELSSFCFDGCKSLASINIPNSVTKLGDGCFLIAEA